MITDDQLLLYYYRELDADDRARIALALAAEPELSQRLHKLIARLDAAAASPDIPVPAATQQRWMKALEDAAKGTPASTPLTPRAAVQRRGYLAAAAALAAVALAIGYQLRTPGSRPVAPSTAAASSNPADSSAYERGLRVHLASTERQLEDLATLSPEQRERMVAAIIDQNRLFALAAERAGEPQLARVLRAFVPVLEKVAEGGAETTAEGIDQLSFEFRVMQARLGASANTPSQTF